jgi:hypothetical protein
MSAGVVGSIHFQCGSMGCSEIFAVPAKEYLSMREWRVMQADTLNEAIQATASGGAICRHCWMDECKRINNHALENRHKSFDSIRATWGRLSADWHEFWLSTVQGTTNGGQTLSDIKDIPFLLDDLAVTAVAEVVPFPELIDPDIDTMLEDMKCNVFAFTKPTEDMQFFNTWYVEVKNDPETVLKDMIRNIRYISHSNQYFVRCWIALLHPNMKNSDDVESNMEHLLKEVAE